MMQHSSSAPEKKERKDQSPINVILRRLRSILMENWGTKLLATLIAIALWAGLITQDPTLTREKHFSDVNVNVIGADTLKRNGYIVLQDLDDLLSNVDVRVAVPQGQYASTQVANYEIRIDLSSIHSTGEQNVRILSSNSDTYGTVTEIDPLSVKLTVDEYVTRYRIPVMTVPIGDVVEGYYAMEASSNPPVIAVSGPKTLVNRIASAKVMVNQADLPAREGTIRRAMPFTLVDEQGEVIDSDMLEVTSEGVLLDSIIVEQEMYSARTVEFSDLALVVGEPAEGYEVKGVYLTPPSVTIAGKASSIEGMDVLYAENNVNIRGLTESVSKALRVRQPTTIKYASTDVVNVAVEIGPIITSRAYEIPITMTGLKPGFVEAGGARTAFVYLTGPQPWLDGLSVADISLNCDLSRINEVATYILPLTCTVTGGEYETFTCEINPPEIEVRVKTQETAE